MLVASQQGLLPHFQKQMRQRFPHALFYRMGQPGEFALEIPHAGKIYFEDYEGIEGIGWDEEELALIRDYFPTPPHVYSIAYLGLEFVKEALLTIANSPVYLVDNDCGTLLPGHEFVLKIGQNPGWYWFDD